MVAFEMSVSSAQSPIDAGDGVASPRDAMAERRSASRR
jgi:hypothetical protein